MLKIRIIPILTFNGFALVKTKGFTKPRMVGNAIQAARVYNTRGVDELVFVDIFATAQERALDLAMVRDILNECYMPVAVGGGISTLEHISDLLNIGADKVVLKSAAIQNPKFISEASRRFGAQCLCISVDAKKTPAGYVIHNRYRPELRFEEFVREMEDNGAGELIVTSVDRDGMMEGFDIDLVEQGERLTSLPVIACGGGGTPAHFRSLFERCSIGAAAAASIFHFTQFTPNDIKRELKTAGKAVRLLNGDATAVNIPARSCI